MRKSAFLAAAAVVALVASPALAAQKVQAITPDKLTLSRPAGPVTLQNSYWLQGGAGGSELFVSVKLPVGATIKKVVALGQDTGAPSGSLALLVFKPNTFCFLGSCSAVQMDLGGFDGLGLGWHTLTELADPGLAKIDRGEKAMIQVSLNDGLLLGQIKVIYTTP